MNYYVVLNSVSIFFALFGWALVFHKYRNPSGLFFFLFTVFVSLWFIFYIIFFSGIQDTTALLYISRLDFSFGVLIVYSLLLFIYYFNTKPSKVLTPEVLKIFGLYASVILFYVSTNLIIESIVYDPVQQTFREVYGKFFVLEQALFILGIAGFIYISYKQLKRQVLLDRIRLKHILTASGLLVATAVFFQLVLPVFGIWILEKELVLTLPIFVIYILYTINRWYFTTHEYGIGKFSITVISIAVSIVMLNVLKTFYANQPIDVTGNYWLSKDIFSVIDTSLGIFFFLITYTLLRAQFLWNTEQIQLKNKFQELRKDMARSKTTSELNDTIRKWIGSIFKTKYAEIVLFSKEEEAPEIKEFFEGNPSEKIFIRDMVFIESKKSKFNKDTILSTVSPEAFLVLPLFNREGNEVEWLLSIGVKPFGDFYSKDEIRAISDFVFSLELHLKYIHTYEQIRELTVNLDKKVDEKTMEYNNLINRQKEFISLISHEIKSPIANAIFQVDSMLDDMKTVKLSEDQIKEELETLNNQLINVGELLGRLFSVQYFDIHSVSLFKEKVQVGFFLQTEFDVYSRMNEHIQFINQISDKIGFVSVDRIQLQQVMSNLLNNAVKFLTNDHPAIIIEANKKDGHLHIIVEDNGPGFEDLDVSKLFEKYGTGKQESVGLGMGLYLCRKIVELHGGEISAGVGERLWGAKFVIKIPVE